MEGRPSVKQSVKRLSGITVVDLHALGIRDMKRILSSLPIVIAHVQAELARRDSAKVSLRELTPTGSQT